VITFERMAKTQIKAKARPRPALGRNDSAPPAKKIGRPRAKHSDPDYVQMSIYVHKDVRTKVKMRLFETSGEFSGLVESLLRAWLIEQA
jgi:hypothetical protein